MIFLLPTLNEEKGLKEVLLKIKENFPGWEILVIDGGSKDRTVEIAKKFDCKIIRQSGKGKGNAIIDALNRIKEDEIVAMLDADGTYEPEDVKNMLEFLGDDMIVIGTRYKLRERGAFTKLNFFGDKELSFIASILFFRKINDLLSGLRLFKAKTIKNLNLTAQNFEIETEMTLKAIKNGMKIVEVPCHYYKRYGKAKLHPFKDGFRILKRIFVERFC